MNFEKNPQHDFSKMRGGRGSTAVRNFSENSSVFEGTGFPYAELQLGRRLRELAVEGEEGEDGDQVGGELVLLQPLLHWVQQWRRQDLKQSLKERDERDEREMKHKLKQSLKQR